MRPMPALAMPRRPKGLISVYATAQPRTTEDLIALLDQHHTAVKAMHTTSAQQIEAQGARLTEIEQHLARRLTGGGPAVIQSLGAQVVASDGYKNFKAAGLRGTGRIAVMAMTSDASSAGPLIAPDRQSSPVMLPRQRLKVRDLLAPGQTNSNLVQFTRQTGRTNNAAVVTEAGQKPESNITFEQVDAPVRTIATWIPVSRQAMDDAPLLQSTIDTELRYMIDITEEQELLNADGTGVHVLGLIPQATAFSPPFSINEPTMLDSLLLGIAQAQQSKIMATGVIVNDLDWKKMQAIKDGQGRYIGGGPFGSIGNNVWTLPVVDTPAMAQGEFMVGAFAVAAQVIDRMQTEVLVSSEDRDNFIKNMLTVRAEERVALAVKMPEAIVHGDYLVQT
jgi:HK97 family phage major capsid protein